MGQAKAPGQKHPAAAHRVREVPRQESGLRRKHAARPVAATARTPRRTRPPGISPSRPGRAVGTDPAGAPGRGPARPGSAASGIKTRDCPGSYPPGADREPPLQSVDPAGTPGSTRLTGRSIPRAAQTTPPRTGRAARPGTHSSHGFRRPLKSTRPGQDTSARMESPRNGRCTPLGERRSSPHQCPPHTFHDERNTVRKHGARVSPEDPLCCPVSGAPMPAARFRKRCDIWDFVDAETQKSVATGGPIARARRPRRRPFSDAVGTRRTTRRAPRGPAVPG